MGILRNLSDNLNEHSLATRLRRERIAFFRELLTSVSRPVKILDVGGTRRFWGQMGFENEEDTEITVLNFQQSELDCMESAGGKTHFQERIGDARSMPEFRDGEFDVVFSNSVLEHVGDREDQQRMMDEVRRVGKRYFVQTPNFFFPIEPHFHVLGYQFLPVRLRAELLRRFKLGWTERISDLQEAEAVVRSVRLLSRGELRQLCPEASIYVERFFGLAKSFVLYDGWDITSDR